MRRQVNLSLANQLHTSESKLSKELRASCQILPSSNEDKQQIQEAPCGLVAPRHTTATSQMTTALVLRDLLASMLYRFRKFTCLGLGEWLRVLPRLPLHAGRQSRLLGLGSSGWIMVWATHASDGCIDRNSETPGYASISVEVPMPADTQLD